MLSNDFNFSGPYLPLKLPIRVWGLDVAGRPFTQEALTESISQGEACVTGLRSEVKLNEIIGLSCEGRKGRFRVIAVRDAGSSTPAQIEVRSLDPFQNIWGVDFSQLPVERPERRSADRYRCRGAVSIWQKEPQYPIHAGVSDISLGGCYVDVMYPLPVGTKVSLALNISEKLIRATGQVCTSHPALGMGVNFESINDTDKAVLKQIIETLAKADEAAT